MAADGSISRYDSVASRAAIDAAQNRAFALFNELNVDNDYDIVCRRETPTGSYIPVRTCRPRYVDRLETIASQDFLAGDGYFDPTISNPHDLRHPTRFFH